MITSLLALTFFMPMIRSIVSLTGAAFVSSYLGLLLLGGVFLVVELFASSLTENQIIAARSFWGLICLWMLSIAVRTVSSSTHKSFSPVVPYEHLNHFIRGLLDTSDIIFYLNFIAFGLFLHIAFWSLNDGNNTARKFGATQLPWYCFLWYIMRRKLSGFRHRLRTDLSSSHVFSLAPQSVSVVKGLARVKAPISGEGEPYRVQRPDGKLSLL